MGGSNPRSVLPPAYHAMCCIQPTMLCTRTSHMQCLDSYNAAGGDAGLVNRAPSCNVSGFNLNACCGEVKSIYNADGFLGCLCNQQVGGGGGAMECRRVGEG